MSAHSALHQHWRNRTYSSSAEQFMHLTIEVRKQYKNGMNKQSENVRTQNPVEKESENSIQTHFTAIADNPCMETSRNQFYSKL